MLQQKAIAEIDGRRWVVAAGSFIDLTEDCDIPAIIHFVKQ